MCIIFTLNHFKTLVLVQLPMCKFFHLTIILIEGLILNLFQEISSFIQLCFIFQCILYFIVGKKANNKIVWFIHKSFFFIGNAV